MSLEMRERVLYRKQPIHCPTHAWCRRRPPPTDYALASVDRAAHSLAQVAFTRIPYDDVVARARWQDAVVSGAMWLAGGSAALAAGVAGYRLWSSRGVWEAVARLRRPVEAAFRDARRN